MWQQDEQTQESMGRAWELLGTKGRGDILTHEEASTAMGVGPPDPRYYNRMERLRRRLEIERGISLISVSMTGYALCTPKEQLEATRDRVKRATRQLRKGRKTVASLPIEECSAPEQRAKFAMEEKLATAERSMRKESTLMAFLMRPRETIPRITNDDAASAG